MKFCVFCGQEPINKTDEHIIPQWLIELTGDKSRLVNLGYDKSNNFEIRRYSFNSFVFPACSKCNNDYGILEKRAKSIIYKMLTNQKVSAQECSWLLDWFDKVRVGIWLGNYYLDKNWMGINPRFAIGSRIGRYDRFLGIYRTLGLKNHLSFFGTESLSFVYMPSCFNLNINHLSFINVSAFNLFSKELGFPYCKSVKIKDDQTMSLRPCESSGLLSIPQFHEKLLLDGTEIYQPMFFLDTNNDLRDLYFDDYVKNNCIDFEHGIGNIYIIKNGTIEEYPSEPSNKWISRNSGTAYELIRDIPILTINIQNFLFELISYDNNISEDFQSKIEEREKLRELWDNKILRMHKEKLEDVKERQEIIDKVTDSYF